MTVASAASMAAIGFVLFLAEGGLLYLVMSVAWNPLAAWVSLVLLFGVTGLFSWQRSQTELADTRYEVDASGRKRKIRVPPAATSVWTWAFGSLEPDQSVIEKILGVVMLVPRLFCAAWYTWRRAEQVRRIDAETTLEILKILFRRSESVCVGEIARSLGDVDLLKAVRDVALLDGIVFLTTGEPAISVAPRLMEDLEAWRTAGRSVPENDSQFGT